VTVAGLNLGCGGALLEGWLNTDLHPAPGAARLDLTEPFALPDGGSCAGVGASASRRPTCAS
jgi:hypothetical protein